MIGERSGRKSPASSWPSAWVWRMVVAIMAIVSNLLIGDFWRPGGEQSGEGERLSQIMRRHDAAMRCELRTLADSLSLAPGRDTLQTMESVAKEARTTRSTYSGAASCAIGITPCCPRLVCAWRRFRNP